MAKIEYERGIKGMGHRQKSIAALLARSYVLLIKRKGDGKFISATLLTSDGKSFYEMKLKEVDDLVTRNILDCSISTQPGQIQFERWTLKPSYFNRVARFQFLPSSLKMTQEQQPLPSALYQSVLK